MSFVNANLPIQKAVENYVKGKPEELTMALLAARRFNTTITETDLQSEAGKKRQLKINFYPAVCEDTGTCGANICEPGVVLQPQQQFFDISQCTASAVYQLNRDDIRNFDGAWTFSKHAEQQIASVLPTVRGKMAAQMAALLYANAGLTPQGFPSRNLPFIDGQNGVVNPVGMWEIERAYRDTGYSNPFIVGGAPVFQWQQAVGVGGLNQYGQNIAQLGRTNLYYDSRINTAAGDPTREHIISFDPQMLKFVSFNRNAGIFATDLRRLADMDRVYWGGETFLHGTMVDPMTGLIWDLNIDYDKCNHSWKFQIELQWDIFFMPPQVCNIQGVNGIFHWTSCPPVLFDCPTDVSPLVPAASATFNYQTSGNITFPLAINSLNIGGQVSYPNMSVANINELAAVFNDSYSGVQFTVSGTQLRYTGYEGITFTINAGTGEINGTFA